MKFFIFNVGKTDKIVRLILAFIVAFLGWYFNSYWGYLSLVLLLSPVLGWCPLYIPFGINTNKKKLQIKIKKAEIHS